MTPASIVTAARNKYNAVGSDFYSDTELFDLIYEAEQQLLRIAPTNEASSTTATATGTQAYTFPTNMVTIKRVQYQGGKLQKVSMREDDVLTLHNQASTEQGEPQYYYEWAGSIYLRPIPDTAGTMTIFGCKEPVSVSTDTTLEVPERFHMTIVNYLASEIAAKDSNFEMANHYLTKWQKSLDEIETWWRIHKRADKFNYVHDEDEVGVSILGRL